MNMPSASYSTGNLATAEIVNFVLLHSSIIADLLNKETVNLPVYHSQTLIHSR